ncbi:DODA-type extradiol aromatic ring-opening family dioxygenase [Sulfurisphaera ohwakuensis]|uniref:DODA-type extradiol aromatic ring-opening family dioxygenase n=1 Tax=Sulfurisphaera ohwakuensis TaxID=69656 RepID=UPI0036F3517C
MEENVEYNLMKGIFVSHGSPMILVENDPWKDLLREWGKKLGKFDSIIIISPHFFSWSGTFLVETQPKLECIQDYYGFPDELYKFCYSADNDVDLANKIVEEGQKEGLPIKQDNKWGLDHGAWIPLMYMYPEGVKVVTISITDLSAEIHYKLGEVIGRVVGDRNVLIIGTGSPTHRLELMYLNAKPRQTKFDQILIQKLKDGDFTSLFKLEGTKEWEIASPEGMLRPLFVVLGAVKPKKAEIIGYEVPYGGVSMLAVEFYS